MKTFWNLATITVVATLVGCDTGPKHHHHHDHDHHHHGETGSSAAPMEAFDQEIPGTSVVLSMVPIPAGDSTGAFYASANEQTWDLYDVFIFNLDSDDGQSTPEADAVTRPSKPYVMADRGYGHQGYPLLSASPKAAEQFVEWLSVKTGRKFRLPTEAEFKLMLERSGVTADNLQEFAWVDENSEFTTHPIRSKPADGNGLHDLWGNVSEYVVKPDGTYAVMGGSFVDYAEDVSQDYSKPFTTDWNKDDPQIPKSPWWLASNDWVGIRVVCDVD